MTATAPGNQQVTDRIRSLAASLSPTEQRVARTIISDPDGMTYLSVSELAALADSSVATVVRLCQHLGYKGFHDLKLRLAREMAAAGMSPPQGDDETDAAGVLAGVMRESADAFRSAIYNIDAVSVEAAAGHLVAARRVLFIAVGTSAPIVADAAYRLTTLGLDAVAPPDVHVQHVTARLLAPGDVCVTVSHTGATSESLAATAAAAEAGATTVAITSFARSPLTELADHSIIAGSAETQYRVEAMTSRLLHIAVLDAIFVLVARGVTGRSNALDLTAQVLASHRY